MQFVDRLDPVHAVTKEEQKFMGHYERDVYAFLIEDFLKVPSVRVVPLDGTQVVGSPHLQDLFGDALVDKPQSFMNQFVVQLVCKLVDVIPLHIRMRRRKVQKVIFVLPASENVCIEAVSYVIYPQISSSQNHDRGSYQFDVDESFPSRYELRALRQKTITVQSFD